MKTRVTEKYVENGDGSCENYEFFGEEMKERTKILKISIKQRKTCNLLKTFVENSKKITNIPKHRAIFYEISHVWTVA